MNADLVKALGIALCQLDKARKELALAISQGTGDGRQVVLQATQTYIQWQYAGDTTWNDLIAIAELKGTAGQDGKSAYELAVEAGFAGTESEWLLSLIGAKGDAGQVGPAGKGAGISYLWAQPIVDQDSMELVANWTEGHIAQQGYLYSPTPVAPDEIWPNKNYRLLVGDKDMFGADFKAFIDTWDDSTNDVKGYLIITSQIDPTHVLVSAIAAASYDGDGNTAIDFQYVSSSGITEIGFMDDEPVLVQFVRAGDKAVTDQTVVPMAAPPVDMQIFNATTAGAIQTWTRPEAPEGCAPYKEIAITMISGGGGGGSGRAGDPNGTHSGGTGGGAGAFMEFNLPYALAGSTEEVQVGVGGAGGASVSGISPFTNGKAGSTGTSSSFGKVANKGIGIYLQLDYGYGGAGGTNLAGSGGSGTFNGGAGGGNAAGGAGSNSNAGIWFGATGGGGGGGINASNVTSGGGGGTRVASVALFPSPIVPGGVAPGGNGSPGTPNVQPIPGQGGGGGASSTSGPAGSGGNGANYGAGGGGGGASSNPNPSGAGGKGGDGIVVISCR